MSAADFHIAWQLHSPVGVSREKLELVSLEAFSLPRLFVSLHGFYNQGLLWGISYGNLAAARTHSVH